jgi:hypothetical protein
MAASAISTSNHKTVNQQQLFTATIKVLPSEIYLEAEVIDHARLVTL